MWKRGAISIAAAVLLAAAVAPARAADKGISAVAVTDAKQIAAWVADNWSEDFYGEITVSAEEGTAYRDGKKVSLQSVLPVTQSEETALLSADTDTEQILEKKYGLETWVDDEEVIHITDPYQTARLIVYADHLNTSYGAKQALRDAKHGMYLLQYADSGAAKRACTRLRAKLGDSNCHPDRIYTGLTQADLDLGETEELTVEDEQTAPTVERPVCVSWGSQAMGLDKLKTESNGRKMSEEPVTVAIVDSGLTDNEAFQGRTVSGHSFVGKQISDQKFSAKDYTDYGGHGTHVAGIIADGTNNKVSLMALRIFDGYKHTSDAIVESALQYAIDKGADVINLSISSHMTGRKDSAFHQWDTVLQRAYDKGIPVIAAAGNEGAASVHYPACLPTTIAVSAIDAERQLWEISNYGGEIDFAAPGVDILSASAGDYRSYLYLDGTSMATAHVTACMAVLRQIHPEDSVEQSRQRLADHCEDIGEPGKDTKFGHGMPVLRDLYEWETAERNIRVLWSAHLRYTSMAYNGKPRKNAVHSLQYYNAEEGIYETVDPSQYEIVYENNTNVGEAVAVITGKGNYTGRIRLTYKIIPQTVMLGNVTASAGRRVTVKWTPVSQADGYQIASSSGRQMTKVTYTLVTGKTAASAVLKAKDTKKCYLMVRSYKTVQGKKVWGRWSELKSVKIKK